MEVGRVAVVTYGPDVGKYVVIVDIVDQSRVLILYAVIMDIN